MSTQLLLAVVAGPLGLALAAPLTAAALGIFEVLVPIENASAASNELEIMTRLIKG
jgi:hypothetical protein